MIRRIFLDLSDDRYNEAELARRFGLSKATVSRFAGSRWLERSRDGDVAVPDLWANTAHVLARYGPFVEAAEQAGVWKRVRAILNQQDARMRS